MAKKKETDVPVAVEPRFLARLLGDHGGTLNTAGIIIAALSGWAIWSKLTTEGTTPVGVDLYVYLAVGLGLCGAVAALKYILSDEVEVVTQRRRAMKESKLLGKEARRCLKSYRRRLSPPQTAELSGAAAELEEARLARDWTRLDRSLLALDKKLDEHLSFARKSTLREYTESIAVAVLIALLLRAFVVEAFKIPSGSMIPTLQVGDHIFVNKFIYGIRLPWPLDETSFGKSHPKFFMSLRKPKRGEVIVFKFPKEPEKDFIKRIVAIEGDDVEVKRNVIFVNGAPAEHQYAEPCEYEDFEEAAGQWVHRYCERYKDALDGTAFTTIQNRDRVVRGEECLLPACMPAQKIPPGHVFVMGDNRDNSHDSRFWGPVPFELIKGKALFIWWSSGEPEGIRVKRMLRAVD